MACMWEVKEIKHLGHNCAAPKGMVFWLFWSEIGYQFRPFWSEIWYGLCTLVLNWVCFLEEATSSSFGDKTIPV